MGPDKLTTPHFKLHCTQPMQNITPSFLLKTRGQPKWVASLADLRQNHPHTSRLCPLTSFGHPRRPGHLDRFPQKIEGTLVFEPEWPAVFLTNHSLNDQQKIFLLYKKWSFLGGPNSLVNCFLSSKYGINDFYLSWMEPDPLLQKLRFLDDSASQALTNGQLFADLQHQQTQLLENEAILALDARMANETSAQMVRQNNRWLEASIESANAQLAEAHFQFLEDLLDAETEMELSTHLKNADWVESELSNQIFHLHGDFMEPQKGPSIRCVDRGGSGHGGGGPSETPEGPLSTGLILVLWGATLVALYSFTQWALYKFSVALNEYLIHLNRWDKNISAAEEEKKLVPVKRWPLERACKALKAFYVVSAKGAVLAFSAVVGDGPLRQAVRQIVLPELQRAAEAAVEAWIPPAALRDLVPVVRAGRYVLSRIILPVLKLSWPIVRSCLGVGAILAVCPALLGAYESVATAVEPIMISAMASIPKNVPLQSVFLSRVLQITGGTYLCSCILTTTSQAIERPSVWRVARVFVPMAGLYVVLGHPYYFSVSTLQKNLVLQTLLNCQMGRLTLLVLSPLFLKMLRVPYAEIPYIFLLYYLQMYPIALSATPNMFP